MLDYVLERAQQFYKVENLNCLLAKFHATNCFSIKCYDRGCGCGYTNSCDLEPGESINSVYPTAVEISKEEFVKLWNECQTT
jgi:hypothetical protein